MKAFLLILPCLFLTSCFKTYDANGKEITGSWATTAFTLSFGFKGVEASVSIPSRQSAPVSVSGKEPAPSL